MSRANHNEAEFEGLDLALTVIMEHWNQPTRESKEKVSNLIYPHLHRMEKKALRRLPQWLVDSMERVGVDDPKTTILLKILNGLGKNGIGDFNPAKGKLSPWIWTMMVRQTLTLVRQVNTRSNKVGGFEMGEDGEGVGMENHSLSQWNTHQWAGGLKEYRKNLYCKLVRFSEDCGDADSVAHMVNHFLKTGEILTHERQAQMLGTALATTHRKRKASAKMILRDMAEAEFGPLAV